MELNLDNVSEGQVFRTYTALCKALGIKAAKGTNSRSSQRKEIERYLLLENIEGSYAIRVIKKHNPPLPKPFRSDDKYSEAILVSLFSAVKDSKPHTFERKDLFATLGFTNNNFKEHKLNAPQIDVISPKNGAIETDGKNVYLDGVKVSRTPFSATVSALSEKHGINYERAFAIYSSLSSHIWSYVPSKIANSLDSLESRELLTWSLETIIVENGIERCATEEEKAFIEEINNISDASAGTKRINDYNMFRTSKSRKKSYNDIGWDSIRKTYSISVDLRKSKEFTESLGYDALRARQLVNEQMCTQAQAWIDKDIAQDALDSYEKALAAAALDGVFVIEEYYEPEEIYEISFGEGTIEKERAFKESLVETFLKTNSPSQDNNAEVLASNIESELHL